MLTWQQLVRCTDSELARIDLASLNLACAVGLPGSDRIDHERCIRKLDDWSRRCRAFTNQMMPYFYRGHCDFPNSEPKFRIQAMVTHLQRDLGVRYDPHRIPDDATFQPEDSFVHGVIQDEGGTCGNLPVVYASVARRLGYPVNLVTTRNHLFCRWDGAETFNIEASGQGVSFFPDDHYRTGHFTMPDETVRRCGFLQSLSPRQELASFLSQRGECWLQERDYDQATTAFACALELNPSREQYRFQIIQCVRLWKATLATRLPSRHFPKLNLRLPAYQFPKMPKECEREIVGLKITQSLLNDIELDQRWWKPLRANADQIPATLPDVMAVDFRWGELYQSNPQKS